LWLLLGFAFFAVPWLGNDYWFSAILVPLLVLSLAGLGLNLLTGYAGQLSLGSAAFMAVGAFAPYNLHARRRIAAAGELRPGGVIAALVAVLFGLPYLRIKGFSCWSRPWPRSSWWSGCSRASAGLPTTTPPA
jgi:branched-chain amino acid transport system permease protein